MQLAPEINLQDSAHRLETRTILSIFAPQFRKEPMKNTPRYAFIYFDIDDTLLDHKAAEQAALEQTRRQRTYLHHIATETLQQTYHRINAGLWKQYGEGHIDRAFLESSRFAWTLRDLGTDLEHADDFRETYMGLYERNWDWIPGAKQALTLISRHYPVGFLTNGFSEVQQKKADRFALMDLTSQYIISEDVGCMKPMAGIFEYATRRAGVRPDEILYVGDSLTSDIQGGASFGWHTAWFNRVQPDQHHHGAVLSFNDFAQLLAHLNIQG